MPILDEVLADLSAEGDELDRIVSGLSPEQWGLQTPAPGWTISHQIGHLAATDEMTVLAATDAAAFDVRRAELMADFDVAVTASAAGYVALPPERLLSRWRQAREAQQKALAAVPAGQKVPWVLVPLAPASLASTRLMELFAHGQDIADSLGVQPAPTDRIAHIARLGVRTRDYAFLARDLTPPAAEFRIELTAPSGQLWVWGPRDADQSVTGPAADFCLLVTQRRHRDDLSLVAHGSGADQWLSIAQVYAGPPGPGRKPGQFG